MHKYYEARVKYSMEIWQHNISSVAHLMRSIATTNVTSMIGLVHAYEALYYVFTIIQ